MNCITTLTGPSGTGKSTLAKYLCDNHGFMEMISTTSRDIRPGEVDGVNYNFTTAKHFEEMIERGELMQYVNFLGNYYGATAEEVDRAMSAGKLPLIVVEPTGVPQIEAFCERNNMRLNAVFLDNPEDVLIKRLLERLLIEESPKVDTYVNRILSTLGDEREWSSRFEYDMYFDRMDADVMEQAARAIQAAHTQQRLALSSGF